MPRKRRESPIKPWRSARHLPDRSAAVFYEDLGGELWNYHNFGRKHQPEKTLMAAVIHLAVAHATDPRHHKLAPSAMDWLMSDDLEWPFSFLRLCEALDISPSKIRKEVLNAQVNLRAVPARIA